MNMLQFALRYRVIIILGVALIVAGAMVPGFLTVITAGLTLDRAASTGLIAIGMTVLLISGQIDLSSGSVFAISGIVAVILQPVIGIWPAAGVGLLTGLACGAVNAFLVVGLGINSLVATLASMLAFRAIAHWITDSQPVSGVDIMFALWISQTFGGIFTLRSALFVIGIILLHLWLTKTTAGRNVFAVGSSAVAARASGLRAGRIFSLGFMFAGTLAGLAGVLQSLSVNTGSPVFGTTLTVAVIAAVVVGGTRIEGGRGSALGTLGGVLTIAVLITAMEFMSQPAFLQQIVTGFILILLVVLDRNVRTKPGRTLAGIMPKGKSD